MKLKILVRTPKNQAHKSVNTQKKYMLSIKQIDKVIEQKVLAHNKFYWIIEYNTDKEYFDIISKCSKGEVTIRRFYRTLFKYINRANKLASKFKKGFEWIKRWLIKKISSSSSENEGLKDYINNMSDEEMQGFIKIDDKTEIEELLDGDLITVSKLD